MARNGKNAGKLDAPAEGAGDVPNDTTSKGRKPASSRPRRRAPSPTDSVEVPHDAGEVVSTRVLGPDLGQALRLCDEVTGRLKSLRADQDAASRELDQHREQSRAAVRQLLQELRDATDRVRRESEAATAQLAEVRDASRSLLAECESQLAVVRQLVPTARGQFQMIPEQVDEHRHRSDEPRSATAGRPSGAQARFGVTVDPGVVVADVRPGTPAEVAGLAPGDVIEAIDGDSVSTVSELRDLIQDAADGKELVLRVNHGGSVRDVTIRLDPKTDEARTRLGLTVHPGVVIVETVPGTPAASAGLAPGDVITEVNGTPVLTGKQFRDAILGWSGGEFVLRVCRGGETREIAKVG